MESWYDLEQFWPNDGQSDSLKIMAPQGAFVVPAMAVAHLGRGSSGAGHDYLESLVSDVEAPPEGAWGPIGSIDVARDEFVFMPWEVASFGNGDIKDGARYLEKLVEDILGEPVGHRVD